MKILEIIEKLGDSDNYEGYVIKTDSGAVNILIDSETNCCEEWGYISSEDDFSDYIGSEVLSVELVDENSAVTHYDLPDQDFSKDSGGAVFVNVCTSKGVLQFVVYNCHNGYYGHDVKVFTEHNDSKVFLYNEML